MVTPKCESEEWIASHKEKMQLDCIVFVNSCSSSHSVMYLWIYVAPLTVQANQMCFQCERPREKRAILREKNRGNWKPRRNSNFDSRKINENSAVRLLCFEFPLWHNRIAKKNGKNLTSTFVSSLRQVKLNNPFPPCKEYGRPRIRSNRAPLLDTGRFRRSNRINK